MSLSHFAKNKSVRKNFVFQIFQILLDINFLLKYFNFHVCLKTRKVSRDNFSTPYCTQTQSATNRALTRSTRGRSSNTATILHASRQQPVYECKPLMYEYNWHKSCNHWSLAFGELFFTHSLVWSLLFRMVFKRFSLVLIFIFFFFHCFILLM